MEMLASSEIRFGTCTDSSPVRMVMSLTKSSSVRSRGRASKWLTTCDDDMPLDRTTAWQARIKPLKCGMVLASDMEEILAVERRAIHRDYG